MPEKISTWFRDNQTLVVFLVAQTIALIAGGLTLVTYAVRLETRVAILETRGAPYTVERLNKIDERLIVLEQAGIKNGDHLRRIIDLLTKDIGEP